MQQASNACRRKKLLHRHILITAVFTALPQLAMAEGALPDDTLDEVSVSAPSLIETAHDNTEDYVANRTTTATKTDTPILETPQSISVVTNQQMVDQGASTLQEAVRYSAGVTSEAYGLDNRGDWLFIRGIEHTQILDGLRSQQLTYNFPRPDAYFMERIEILRGPSSVLFGQASPGGLVNIVSKRPQAESQHEVTLSYGNRDYKQIAFDSTGQLNESGTALYRLVGLGRDTDLQSDYTDNTRWQIAPSLTLKPSDQTNLTFFLNYQNDQTDGATASFPPHVGTILANPNGKIGTDFFSGEPGFDKTDTRQQSIGWEFSHVFNDTWTARQNFRYTDGDYENRTIYPAIFDGVGTTTFFLDPQQRTVARYGYATKSNAKTYALDNQLQATFNTGTAMHTTLVGIDYMHSKLAEKSASTFITTPFDLFAPVYGNITTADLPTNLSPLSDIVNSQIGFYAQDQVKLGRHWSVVAGLRHDRATAQTEDGISRTQTDQATTGRVGAVYLADNGLAPYISYSESFIPVVGGDLFGKAYRPKRGKQTEVGLRYQPLDSNSMYTISAYKLKESNRLSSDPSNPLNQLQGGESKVWGVELSAVANLTDRTDLIANYSYTHARTNTDGAPYVAEVHDHTASTWATYRFSIAGIPGFEVGAGVRYVGSNTDETGQLHIPSVTLYDAMLSYENPHWKFALNGNNLTDKTYIATCLSRGDCWYGSRGSVIGSLTYKF